MQRLQQLILAVEEQLGAQVLIYNLSAVTPGEQIHCWLGAHESIALRVQRFNLRLAELSAQLVTRRRPSELKATLFSPSG